MDLLNIWWENGGSWSQLDCEQLYCVNSANKAGKSGCARKIPSVSRLACLVHDGVFRRLTARSFVMRFTMLTMLAIDGLPAW